ncbi:MAG: methyltransferase domain-containing protein [Planctomycetes bacterium]|nr:methyltransferase domain-containing protein [Planctomycetota bacterium]
MHSSPSAVRNHYDRFSRLYRLFWGDHIHHGWYDGRGEPTGRLVEELARRARIPRGARVLDVGCGLGGSAVWLANNLECDVTGITLSPVQARLATARARREGVAARVRARVGDAAAMDLPDGGFDAVWIVECSEHVADKPALFRRLASALAPGGRLALAAWLRAEGASAEDICRLMVCPSLGTLGDHAAWLRTAGLIGVKADDVTPRVAQTWDDACRILAHPTVRALVKLAGRRAREFAEGAEAMRRGFAAGTMRYGMFVARKPR